MDDQEDTVRHRLTVYHDQTRPLVDFYSSMAEQSALTYVCVEGVGDFDTIRARMFDALGSTA